MKKITAICLSAMLCFSLQTAAWAQDSNEAGPIEISSAEELQITIPEGTANAGIVGGGLEQTSVIGCKGTGTITAGDNCYGLGGISGCGFGAEEFTDCAASDITITTGNDCYWIGGITGYAGGYEDQAFGIPVTVFTGCTAENVTVTTGENADGIGELVGSGFYSEEAAEMMGTPLDTLRYMS